MSDFPLPPTQPPGTISAHAPGSPKPFALGLVFVILLMDIVGLLILMPVAPFLVRQYSLDAIAVTLVTVIYAAAQFFAAPLMGKLGDRYGRRPVLIISLAGQAVGYILFGVGGSLWILYLGRLVGGFTGGNLSTASAYIADVSRPGERARNFALIGIAWSLGLILGPAAGALLGEISLYAPPFAASGLTAVNVLLCFFFLPESLPPELRNKEPLRLSDMNPIASIAGMARKPGLGWLLLVTSMFNLAFNAISSTSSLFFIQKFHANPGQVGSLLTIAGVGLAVVQFLLVQRVVRWFGERRVATTSLVFQGLGNLAIFLAPALWLVYPINMLVAAISGFTFPTLTTLNTSLVQPREVGLLMGVTTAIASLTNIIGPLLGGVAFDYIMVGAPYWIGAAIFILAGLLLWRLPVTRPVS